VTILLNQVHRAAYEVAVEHPDRLNPYLASTTDSTGQAVCAYTDANDPDWHCMAGTVLLKLGLELPEEGESVLSYLAMHPSLIDSPGGDFLVKLQYKADMGHVWSTAYELARRSAGLDQVPT
jgi:hypothetical protein